MKRPVVAIVAVTIVVAAVVGVALVRRDGGSHGPARLPVALAARTTEGGATDAALAPYGLITYHAGPSLPTLDAPGHAYRVTAADRAETTQRVRAALAGNGDPSSIDAQLVVSDRDWNFSRGGGDVTASTPTCPPDAPKCVPPTPSRPATLPSQEDARRLALELLERAGFDTNGASVSVDDGITQWFVSVQPVVDGLPTEGFGFSVVIGENGVIQSASGVVGTPLPVDDYPLIGTSAAIERLNRGEGYAGGGGLEAQDAIATADAPVASGAPGSVGPAEPSAAPIPEEPPEPGGEPPVTDIIPPPPPQDITLTGAEVILLYVTSYDGTEGWLVPAYRFSTSDGPGPTVIAVDERFLQPAEAVNQGR